MQQIALLVIFDPLVGDFTSTLFIIDFLKICFPPFIIDFTGSDPFCFEAWTWIAINHWNLEILGPCSEVLEGRVSRRSDTASGSFPLALCRVRVSVGFLSSKTCNRIKTTIFFCLCVLTSTISTSTYADLSTMFDLKFAISFTKTFMIPAFTALSLFSFTLHNDYSVVDASFFAWNPPLSRRFPSGGIAPERPIAALFSSTCNRSITVAVAEGGGRGNVVDILLRS